MLNPIGILLTARCCAGFGSGFLWGCFKITQRFLKHCYTVIVIVIPAYAFLCFSTGLAILLPIYKGRFLWKPWVTHRKQDWRKKKISLSGNWSMKRGSFSSVTHNVSKPHISVHPRKNPWLLFAATKDWLSAQHKDWLYVYCHKKSLKKRTRAQQHFQCLRDLLHTLL